MENESEQQQPPQQPPQQEIQQLPQEQEQPPQQEQPKKSRRGLWIVLVIVGVIVVIAVIMFMMNSQGTSSTAVSVEGNVVVYDGTGYVPGHITISAGETVTWKNESTGDITVNSNPHPIHTGNALLNLGTIVAGAEGTITFTDTGRYDYHNHLRASDKGAVTVE